MPSGPLVAWMNPLPLELTPALRVRRRSLAAHAAGRVLDLGGWTDHLSAYSTREVDLLVGPTDHSEPEDQPGIRRLHAGIDGLVELEVEPYDTVLSLIRTPLVDDLSRFLEAVSRLLADGGRFLFLEPVRRTDAVGRLLAAWGPFVRATSGLYLDRDVVREVRDHGFVVTELDRFEVPSVSAPLRPFVEAQARAQAS